MRFRWADSDIVLRIDSLFSLPKQEESKENISKMKQQAERTIGVVEVHQNEIEELKKNNETQRELLVSKIAEQKNTLELFFKSLEEKVETIETTQVHEVTRVELISQQTEAQEKMAQQMEAKIRQVERDNEAHGSLISMIERTGLETRDSVTSSQLNLQELHSNLVAVLLAHGARSDVAPRT